MADKAKISNDGPYYGTGSKSSKGSFVGAKKTPAKSSTSVNNPAFTWNRGQGGSVGSPAIGSAASKQGYSSTSRAAAQAKDMRQARLERMQQDAAGQGASQETQDPGFSFVDALMQALGMMGDGGSSSSSGGSGGVNYDALRNDLKGRAGEADSRIGAMYRQLQDSYKADAPGIQQSYADTGASLGATADQAAAQTNAAYDSARDAQTKQFEALGIGDAAGVLASQGGGAAQDQARAVSNIESNKALSVNQNAAHGQSAGNYNTNIGQAAGLEGNLQRADIQSQLASKLAQIGISEQEANAAAQQQSSSSSGQNFSQAMQLAEFLKKDYDTQNPQAVAPSASDQQALAEFLYQQQQDTLKSQTGATNDRNRLYTTLLKQFNGDTAQADQVFKSLNG